MLNKRRLEIISKLGLNEADFKTSNPGEPTQADRIEAQVMFTALMTDTLLEEIEEDE